MWAGGVWVAEGGVGGEADVRTVGEDGGKRHGRIEVDPIREMGCSFGLIRTT